MIKRTVKVNENGRRIGEDHPRAKMTDAEVDLLLELRDDGWSYGSLARKFEVSKSQVRNIVQGRQRVQVVVRHKVVYMTDGDVE